MLSKYARIDDLGANLTCEAVNGETGKSGSNSQTHKTRGMESGLSYPNPQIPYWSKVVLRVRSTRIKAVTRLSVTCSQLAMSTDHASAGKTPENAERKQKVKNDGAKKRKRDQNVKDEEGEPTGNEFSNKKPRKIKQEESDEGNVPAKDADAELKAPEDRVVEEEADKSASKKSRKMKREASNEGNVPAKNRDAKSKAAEGRPLEEEAGKYVAKKSKTEKKAVNHKVEALDATEPAKKKKPRKPKAKAEDPVQPTNDDTGPTEDESKVATGKGTTDEQLRTHSPFVEETTSFYLALSPCAYNFPLEGLCAEHISPLLLTYYPPLKGVVMCYRNPRLSEHPSDEQRPQASSSQEAKVVLSKSIDEYAVTYVWLTAEFTVFRPQRGTYLEGHVNLQNESILGLVCYNYFNAGIERSRLPKDWRWVGEESQQSEGQQKHLKQGEGYFVNGKGNQVEGRLVFMVRDFEATAGSEMGMDSINIHGTLLSKKDDRRLDDDERQRGLVR